MIIGLTIYFIISAICVTVLAYFMEENLNLIKVTECVLFGWLFVIIVLLYTIFTLCKLISGKLLDKFIN